MSARTPVLIVGGGPVGLALAGELGWRGVPCTLIEKTDGSIEQPKMDLVGIRIMEFCRRWDILDWVRDAPYPLDYPQDYIYLTALNGYELGREPFPGRGFEPCPPESPQKRERVPQDRFDPILRRFAERSGLATLRYNCELVSFSETPDGVRAQVRDTASGETENIDADYMVGTDGGASTVREQLGIGMSGTPALTYTTNVMFRCRNFRSCTTRGLAIASSSSAPRAPGSPSSRSTAATASACRSSAPRKRSTTPRTTSAPRSSARWAATSIMKSFR